MHPGPLSRCPDLLLYFQVDSAHDGYAHDERDPDEALPDSYRAGGLIRLGLPGLEDEATSLGGQEVSRGVREAVGYHVVGEEATLSSRWNAT